jgi:NAD(P)-dependent dehydrogenase (short-subunit alcohol dehydrogenase family)
MSNLSMTADLAGLSFRVLGVQNSIAADVVAALVANGAIEAQTTADILLVSCPLVPNSEFEAPTLVTETEAMFERGGGRIVMLLSAMAATPMRRHIDYSASMAAVYSRMRGLAMRFGPTLLVNAVGCGLIRGSGNELLSGDPHMLSHLALQDAGLAADVTCAVLFLCDPLNSYTTGQILMVDGGWSAGYGRNF